MQQLCKSYWVLLNNKMANHVLCDAVCRLYQAILYFQNAIQLYSTHTDVILLPPITKVRPSVCHFPQNTQLNSTICRYLTNRTSPRLGNKWRNCHWPSFYKTYSVSFHTTPNLINIWYNGLVAGTRSQTDRQGLHTRMSFSPLAQNAWCATWRTNLLAGWQCNWRHIPGSGPSIFQQQRYSSHQDGAVLWPAAQSSSQAHHSSPVASVFELNVWGLQFV